MYGACDDCGNSLGECTCEDGPEEDIQRGPRGARGHREDGPGDFPQPVQVKLDQDQRLRLLKAVEEVRSSRAVVLESWPKASPPTKHRAKGVVEDLIRHEWPDRKSWRTVHLADKVSATRGREHRAWRYQAVANLRALVWLLRLARLAQ